MKFFALFSAVLMILASCNCKDKPCDCTQTPIRLKFSKEAIDQKYSFIAFRINPADGSVKDSTFLLPVTCKRCPGYAVAEINNYGKPGEYNFIIKSYPLKYADTIQFIGFERDTATFECPSCFPIGREQIICEYQMNFNLKINNMTYQGEQPDFIFGK